MVWSAFYVFCGGFYCVPALDWERVIVYPEYKYRKGL